MKKMILVLFLVSSVFAQTQPAQAPQLKPAAEAQAEFQQARERVKNAQIAAELARRHFRSVQTLRRRSIRSNTPLQRCRRRER
jgi:uncharacterized FlgJ-related protein